MLHIITNIKKYRKLTGLSQEEFAEKIGKKRSTYAEWETNIVPDIATLKEIADAAGVTLADLVGEPTGDTERLIKNGKNLDNLVEANKIHAEANREHSIANKENAIANKKHADSINRMVRLLERANSGGGGKAFLRDNQGGRDKPPGLDDAGLSGKRKPPGV